MSKEFDLMEFLKKNKGKWFTVTELVDASGGCRNAIQNEVRLLTKYNVIKSKYIEKEYIILKDVRVISLGEE